MMRIFDFYLFVGCLFRPGDRQNIVSGYSGIRIYPPCYICRHQRKDIAPSDRSKAVFDQFLSLVSEYHTEHRGMAFYADRLCLTPKYLSKLVKTASGKSAPDWIDGFVILEARNMLRYSDIPIKEIVSRLNFPNPSAFHKFFKQKTGLTPLQYRKS